MAVGRLKINSDNNQVKVPLEWPIGEDGGSKDDILHTAQSQHHDIGISDELGMTNAWIQRRHAQKGYGATIEPRQFTEPGYHFHALIELALAADDAFDG